MADPALLATDLADYLVLKGVPFRDAHHVTGKLVGIDVRPADGMLYGVTAEGAVVTIDHFGNLITNIDADLIRAADELAKLGYEIEIVDLRSIKPLDTDTILASVARTGRLLVVGEAFPYGGVTAEVIARVTAEGFHLLDAPPKRLNARDTPIPYHPNLWAAHRPTAASITDALRELLGF